MLLFLPPDRVARPDKKNEQNFIENFNCTVLSECLGWPKYRVKELTQDMKVFLERCHSIVRI